MSKWYVDTEYPIALDSYDYLYPHGTMRDNYASGNFNKKLFKLFTGEISVLDLGCAGGGFVESVIHDGHVAVGLEGSDYSLTRKRAAWANIPDNLFTCDISKPFKVHQGDHEFHKFDVVTMWEVVEHLEEYRLPQLWSNVRNHLKDGGLYILTSALDAQIPVYEEFNLHRTQKSPEWWEGIITGAGFERQINLEQHFGDHWVRRGRTARRVFKKLGE